MKAIIYFKDAAGKEPAIIDGLNLILADYGNVSKHGKRYDTPEKLKKFSPYADESYVFQGIDGSVSVIGTEILKVEIKD